MKLSPQAVVGRRNGLCILLGCFAIASNALVGFASDEALLGDESQNVYDHYFANTVDESTDASFTNESSDSSSYLLGTGGIPEADATPVAAEVVQHGDESFAEEPASINSEEDKAPGSGTDNRRLAEEDRSTSDVPEDLPVPEDMEDNASPSTDLEHGSETMTSQDKHEAGTEDRRLTSVPDGEPEGEIVNESHTEEEEPFGTEGSELDAVVKAGEQVVPTCACEHHGQMKDDTTLEDADEVQSVSSGRRLDGDEDEIEELEGDDEEPDLARASTDPEEAEDEPLPETGLENQSVPDDNADDENAAVSPTEGAASLRRRLAEESSAEPVQSYCGEACHAREGSPSVEHLPVDNAADAPQKTDGNLRGTAVAQDTVLVTNSQAEDSAGVSL